MIPDYQGFMLPHLRALADGGDHAIRNLVRTLAEEFRLTDAEREEMLPSGQQTMLNNRVQWAKTYLKKQVSSRSRYEVVSASAPMIRMVFVADLIPPELRRIVEFLNVQMDPAEVLALEIKQFVGQGLKTLVPRVIGQTAEAERKKGGSGNGGRQWDEASFFEDLRQRHGEKEADAARGILTWAKKSVPRIWWGKGNRDGSFVPMLDYKGEKHFVTSVWTYGRAEIPFQMMLTRKPFDDPTKRLELRDRLNKIPGVDIPADAINRRPSIPLALLAEDGALTAFLDVLDWYIREVKAA